MTSMLCEGCGEGSFLIPLHGGKGGPPRRPLCVGKWNAEHGRRRRTGRIVIRAIKAFMETPGGNTATSTSLSSRPWGTPLVLEFDLLLRYHRTSLALTVLMSISRPSYWPMCCV